MSKYFVTWQCGDCGALFETWTWDPCPECASWETDPAKLPIEAPDPEKEMTRDRQR